MTKYIIFFTSFTSETKRHFSSCTNYSFIKGLDRKDAIFVKVNISDAVAYPSIKMASKTVIRSSIKQC